MILHAFIAQRREIASTDGTAAKTVVLPNDRRSLRAKKKEVEETIIKTYETYTEP